MLFGYCLVLVSHGEVAALFVSRIEQILKSSDGSRSEAVAGQLFNIGNVFWGQGRLQDALSRYNEALNIYEQTFGKDHERVGATLGNIGSIYYLLGQYENALEAQEEALRIDRLNLQGGQEGVASGEQLGLSLFNTGHTLHKLGRLPEANARCSPPPSAPRVRECERRA